MLGHSSEELGKSTDRWLTGVFMTMQIAWLIATVGTVIASTQTQIISYIWWTIAYQLCCLLAVTFVIGYGTHHRFSMAVSSTRWRIGERGTDGRI